MPKKSNDKKVKEETENTEVPVGKGNIWQLRNLLTFLEKGTEVSSISTDFFEYSQDGCHMKVPVRAESIAPQPLHGQRILHFGLEWGFDGVVTSPIDPITGIAINISTYKGLTYDPSTPWQGADWYYSHGGRMYHALENNIRSNNTISAANRLKLVKALVAYDTIARAVMLFLTAYHCRIDGLLNWILEIILSSSGGSVMFASRDDLLGQIIASFQEQFFPYPFFDFWKNRSHNAYSLQAPWYKYLLMVPLDTNTFRSGLTMLFDAWNTTNQMKHPETYLKEEGLWRQFCTDLVPLLWSKQPHTAYIGGNPVEYLMQIGWAPISYDHVEIEFLLNKFWVHPFDETLGIGQYKLPKHGVTDIVTTMGAYYWDSNGKGNTFYIGKDAFLEDMKPEGVIRSPWLDPVRFVGVLRNYDSNDDGCDQCGGQTISGNWNYAGSDLADISYNEWMVLFRKLAFEFQDFELVEPDPDININAQIAADGYDVNWMELMLYRDTFKFPFKMPDYHWYFEKRKIHKLYANFLNLQLDDVEIYKVQRPLDAANYPANQDEGDKGRF